jgi:hypothetical protein
MTTLLKTLSKKNAELLRQAVKMGGTFNPEDILFYVEERMTIDEGLQAEAFLTWCHENDKTFGWNAQDVYLDFMKEGRDTYQRIVDGFYNGDEDDSDDDVISISGKLVEVPPPSA